MPFLYSVLYSIDISLMYTCAEVDDVSSFNDALLQTIGDDGAIVTFAQLLADEDIVPAKAVDVPSSSTIVNKLVRATSDLYVICTAYIFFTCAGLPKSIALVLNFVLVAATTERKT